MVNQTEFVDHLRERMNEAIEKDFYFESITCSYAIVENRTKRLLEHLGKSASNMSLFEKTGYLYDKIKDKDQENDHNKVKLIGYIDYRLKKSKLLQVDDSLDFKDWKTRNFQDTQNNKIMSFRTLRNDLTHELARYDSGNPNLIDFDEYIDLAYLGKEVADELSRIASNVKKKQS